MQEFQNLEAAIKSTKPMTSHQRAFLNILFTASWLDRETQRRLRPYNLTPQQYNILRILNGTKPDGLSVLEIKNRMLDRASNVSRLVDKLQANGLVQRVQSEQDRRMVVVSISDKGIALVERIFSEKFIENLPGSHLCESAAEQLAALLDDFRR